MDAVYILGSGSQCGDEEIKYSIRSLCKNMLDLSGIFVIGENPVTVPGVHHIHMRDAAVEKWKNAYYKIVRACAVTDISENFLLMNDDFFLLEPVMGDEFPFYALKGSNGGSCGPNSFHVHAPIRVNKEMYLKMPFDPKSKACTSPRTLYANFYGAPPVFIDDVIVRAAKDCKPFDEQIAKLPCFSISDSAMLYGPFRKWLGDLFPMPSEYEAAAK